MSEKIWFTSDNHFFHKSILKFCPDTRGGARDIEEMNELMIAKWNSQVAKKDIVYTLGDFSFGNSEDTVKILRRLNGIKHLIKGNHDYWINGDSKTYFESISEYKEIKIDGKPIVMFHYPIFEWNKMHYGSYHLFGHVHGNCTVPGRAMDVGVDARAQKDMGLWTWEEIDGILGSREVRTHHGKTQVD